MLALTRCPRERVRIKTASGEIIWLEVFEVDRGKVKLAFDAGKSVEIMREELLGGTEWYNPKRRTA